MSISPGMELSAAAQAQAVGESMELSRDKIDEVKLALIEACINAFEHAGATPRVELVFRVVNGGSRGAALEVTVSDRGRGFDPEAVEPPVLEKKLGGGYKRGWGLKIIKNFMDEVEIRSGEKGTTIVMRKYR
jgi:anti-sigma regulatory factor (Ser/Thr protein kinase)